MNAQHHRTHQGEPGIADITHHKHYPIYVVTLGAVPAKHTFWGPGSVPPNAQCDLPAGPQATVYVVDDQPAIQGE